MDIGITKRINRKNRTLQKVGITITPLSEWRDSEDAPRVHIPSLSTIEAQVGGSVEQELSRFQMHVLQLRLLDLARQISSYRFF